MNHERMYEVDGKRVSTWNPFVGCNHSCNYCYASTIAKRQKHRCQKCYDFIPHSHPERLQYKFKEGETVFVCSMGDISFASFDQFVDILSVTGDYPRTTFYIQSKDPEYFIEYLERYSSFIDDNIVLGTTIETDRYLDASISSAPTPKLRYRAMKCLDHNRKYVTIEPIMEFDLRVLVGMIKEINPEFVYIGYNSRDSKNKHLPEPLLEKTKMLIQELEKITEVRCKLIRKAWWEKE